MNELDLIVIVQMKALVTNLLNTTLLYEMFDGNQTSFNTNKHDLTSFRIIFTFTFVLSILSQSERLEQAKVVLLRF